MSQCLQRTTEVKRADVGFHADPTRRQIGEPGFHLARADRSRTIKKESKIDERQCGQAERQIVESRRERRRRCRPIRVKKRRKW
jgi:hypothetical protein